MAAQASEPASASPSSDGASWYRQQAGERFGREAHHRRLFLRRGTRQVGLAQLTVRVVLCRILGIDIRNGLTAESVDTRAKMVLCDSGTPIRYEKLLLAAGAVLLLANHVPAAPDAGTDPVAAEGETGPGAAGPGAAPISLELCGGTHVAQTGEIGRLTIGKVEKKGRMNRRVNLHLA